MKTWFRLKKEDKERQVDAHGECGTITDLAVNSRIVSGQKGGEKAAGNWQFKKHKILYDTGPGGYSVALGESFCDSANACGRMLAMRWNGAGLNDKDIGFPKNAQAPHWFPIPREFTPSVVAKLKELHETEQLLEQWEDQ